MAVGCTSTSPPPVSQEGLDVTRATSALARLGFSYAEIHIFADESLAAYSYSDGSIFLSRGLIDKTTDDQLAAVLAHELGHLTRVQTPVIQSRYTLEGSGRLDQEQQADDFACSLLLARSIPVSSLAQVLTLTRDDPCTATELKPALTRRIVRLPVGADLRVRP